MRCHWLIIALVAGPVTLQAQAARLGRLPVLVLPAAGGTCRIDPANARLRQSGIANMFSFTMSDSSSHRLISVGVNASGAPLLLMAIMGTKEGRRGESESVNASFDSAGHVSRGDRSAFTSGTPAKLADDQKSGLLSSDTLAAQRLVTALLQRCRA